MAKSKKGRNKRNRRSRRSGKPKKQKDHDDRSTSEQCQASGKCSSSEDSLNWAQYNFLENLLVFGTYPSRKVPKESGVRFMVSSRTSGEAVSLLFDFDRKKDPFIPFSEGERPDWLVAYGRQDRLILTIVEMKGTVQKNLAHGVNQIVNLYGRLKKEITDHLPATAMKVHFQGILLGSKGATFPLPKIASVKKKTGLVIMPAQHIHTAELYPYISKKITAKDKYEHQALPHSDPYNLIEELMINCSLRERAAERNTRADSQEEGIHLDYCVPEGVWGPPGLGMLQANRQQAYVSGSSKFCTRFRSLCDTFKITTGKRLRVVELGK